MSIDEVGSRSCKLIDARLGERYRGEGEDPFDPRSGHIPGALSVPCRESLTPSGRFLPAETLRQRFVAAGVKDAREVTVYCGSGVTACHDLLAFEWTGLGRGKLFVGSWSQWSNDPQRPVRDRCRSWMTRTCPGCHTVYQCLSYQSVSLSG